MSGAGLPGNPFVPRALPPAPPMSAVGVREKVARAIGAAKAAAKKKFLEACHLFNAGSFAAADMAFAQVDVQQLPEPFAVQLRINFYRSFCAAIAGNFSFALQLIEPICQQQPYNEPAFALMGRLYYVLGQHEAAVDAFRRAGQSNHVQSGLAAALREHAASLMRVSRLDEARHILEQIYSRQPTVTKWLGQIHAIQAGLYYRAGRYGMTISECRAAEQYGFHMPPLTSLRGLAYLALLCQATAHSNFVQAHQHLTAAHHDLPANASGYLDQIAAGLERLIFATAVARLLARDYATAAGLLQETLSSPFAPLYTRAVLALVLHWNGTTQAAWQVLASVPPDKPPSPIERYLAGYLARRLGLADEAHARLQQLYRDEPDFPGAREELLGASYTLSATLITTDPTRAVEVLQFAHDIKSTPQIDQALNTALLSAGTRSFTQGQYAEAITYFTATLNSSSPPLLTAAYLGLVCLGQAAQALKADNIDEAIQQTELCLGTWLGRDWRADANESQFLQIGLSQAPPNNLHAGWVAQVCAYYAALLLRQALAEPANAAALLRRAKDYLQVATMATPPPALAYGLNGLLAYTFDRDFVTAANQLSAAHAAGLHSSEMLRILAAAAFGAEDYARAIPAYRTLMADQSWNGPTIAVYLAYSLWKTGSLSAAAEVLTPFAHRSNVAPEVVLLCGYLNYLAGEIEQAASLLDALDASAQDRLPLAGILPVVMHEAGVALARTGKLDEAAAQLRRVGDKTTVPPQLMQVNNQALAHIECYRALEALRHDRLDATLERAMVSLNLDEARRDVVSVLISLAHFGQAVNELKRGDTTSALSLLEESTAGLQMAGPDAAGAWSARVTVVRAVLILLADAHRWQLAGELLEQSHATEPGLGLGALLCGAYRWYARHDLAGAIQAWESGRPNVNQALLLLRFLGMSYLLAGRYPEAAGAYAAYRTAAGDPSARAVNYQAWCLLMSNRPREALALFAARDQLDADQSFLRGYARARSGAWKGAHDDLARAHTPRGMTLAALATCQIALGLIGRGDLAGADQALSEALRMGGVEMRPVVAQAQARLRRQQGVALLKQSKFKEAADLLQAATDQGVQDPGTRSAWALTRFVLARARGALPEMQSATEDLKQTLPPPLAARVLVELGCQHVRHASALDAQQRTSTDAQLRSTLHSLLNQAVSFWREALRLDREQPTLHALIGKLAFRLLGDNQLALVHLELAPPNQVSDTDLGDIYLVTSQVFKAKRFFFDRWEPKPAKSAEHQARQILKSLLHREDALLQRFSRVEKAADDRATADENMELADRARVFNQVTERLMNGLPPDRQTRARELRRQLKQALIDNDRTRFDQFECDLIALLGPLLLQ